VDAPANANAEPDSGPDTNANTVTSADADANSDANTRAHTNAAAHAYAGPDTVFSDYANAGASNHSTTQHGATHTHPTAGCDSDGDAEAPERLATARRDGDAGDVRGLLGRQ
jgi:hypothetical protein